VVVLHFLRIKRGLSGILIDEREVVCGLRSEKAEGEIKALAF